jgi:hypothetical protein
MCYSQTTGSGSRRRIDSDDPRPAENDGTQFFRRIVVLRTNEIHHHEGLIVHHAQMLTVYTSTDDRRKKLKAPVQVSTFHFKV